MEEIYAGMLHHEDANERLRTFIRNLVDRVQEQRLAEIKKLLPFLKTALLEEYRSKPSRATSGPSSVTPSETLPLFHPPALVSLSDSTSSSSQLPDIPDMNQPPWILPPSLNLNSPFIWDPTQAVSKKRKTDEALLPNS
jgi:hypothetical protein